MVVVSLRPCRALAETVSKLVCSFNCMESVVLSTRVDTFFWPSASGKYDTARQQRFGAAGAMPRMLVTLVRHTGNHVAFGPYLQCICIYNMCAIMAALYKRCHTAALI